MEILGSRDFPSETIPERPARPLMANAELWSRCATYPHLSHRCSRFARVLRTLWPHCRLLLDQDSFMAQPHSFYYFHNMDKSSAWREPDPNDGWDEMIKVMDTI